jgi:hypothetical protein
MRLTGLRWTVAQGAATLVDGINVIVVAVAIARAVLRYAGTLVSRA